MVRPATTRKSRSPYAISLSPLPNLPPVNHGGAGVLDVVHVGGFAERPRLRRVQAELKPEGLRARLDRFVRVLRRMLGATEDIHEVDRLLDLSERRHAGNSEHLVAVSRPDRDDSVALVEQILHHAMARLVRVRRRADERDRVRVAEDLCGVAAHSIARSQGLVIVTEISTAEINAPVAIIVPGEAS